MAAKLDPSYRTAMENAKKGLKDVGEGAKDGAKDIDAMDIAVGNLVANGITKLVSVAGDAARSLYGLADETREFRQDMGTLETAFDSAGFSADTANETWKDLYAVFGEDDRAVEAANNISRMAQSEQELNDWVKITTGVWGSYQDALPVEGLAEAAGETAKTGKVTGGLADALNWSSEAAQMFAGYMSEDVVTAEDAFNEALAECSNEQERQALINETLMKLYGNAADKYEETAGSVMEANEAQAEYLQTQAEMGERMEPLTTAVKTGLTNLMKAGMDLFANVDFAAWADKVENGFSWLIDTGIPFFIKNLPVLGVAIAGIGATIATFKFASIVGTVKKLGGSIKALWGVFTASPAGMIVAGITLLVTAFLYLWKNCEGFRNFWINLWAKIKAVAGVVWTWLKDSFGTQFVALWGHIKQAASAFANFFTMVLWPAIQSVAKFIVNVFMTYVLPVLTTIWDSIKTNISIAWDFITAIFKTAVSTITGVIDGIIQVATGLVTFFTGIFTGDMGKAADGLSKIFDGIKGAWDSVFTGAANAVIAVLNWLIDKINTISIGPLPDWDILGEYAGAEIGFSIPRIPELAEGGIATGPTLAMIGEGNEAEAVLPLSKLGSLMGGVSETVSIVYSPNITVMPGANGADVRAATEQSFEQFKAYMDRYLRDRKRINFA